MRATFLLACGLLGCRDLSLPIARDSQPGVVSATVLVQRAGRPDLVAAEGAVLELQGTGQRAVADLDGNVRLAGLEAKSGVLRLSWDGDGDGVDDGSRLYDLQLLGAGFGHEVSLGVVVLGRLASVTGLARRADRGGPSGHGGIHVFVPASPAATITADDGSYLLPGLPEGMVPLTCFAVGYAPATNRVALGAGQNQRLAEVLLAPSSDARPAALEGEVRRVDGTPLGDVRVEVTSSAAATSATVTGADGAWRVGGLPEGLTSLRFIKEGFAIARIQNVLLLAGGTAHLGAVLVPGEADAGVEARPDAGIVLARGPVRVISVVGAIPPGVDGGVQLTVPGLAVAGDLVAVLLHRVDPGSAMAGARGWQQATAGLVPSAIDDVQLLWRVAEADEQARPERYWFEAPNGGQCVTFVLRGAVNLVAVASRDATVPILMASVPASPGDLVLDTATFLNPEVCDEPDGGMSVLQFGSIKAVTVPIGPSGMAPGFGVTCGVQQAGRVDQVRVFAAPP